MFFLGLLMGVGLCYLGYVFYRLRANEKLYVMSIDIESEDSVYVLDRLISSFHLKVLNKRLTRDHGMRLDMSFRAHPLVHHVFLKRLYTMQGLGRILKI